MKTMTTENDDNSKSSEQYIIRLLQTIESLDSTMRSMREETALLREKLARMDASLEEKELERKRLLALMEAKDQDNRRMALQMSDLLCKVAALTKALEDKSHQLLSRNRGQFGTKTAAKTTQRVDDHVETPDFISGDIKGTDLIGLR